MEIIGMEMSRNLKSEFEYLQRRRLDLRGKKISGNKRIIGSVEGVEGIKKGYKKD